MLQPDALPTILHSSFAPPFPNQLELPNSSHHNFSPQNSAMYVIVAPRYLEKEEIPRPFSSCSRPPHHAKPVVIFAATIRVKIDRTNNDYGPSKRN